MHAGTRGAFDVVRKVKSRQEGNLGPGRAKTCRPLHLFSPSSPGEMQPALPTEAEKPVHRRGKSNENYIARFFWNRFHADVVSLYSRPSISLLEKLVPDRCSLRLKQPDSTFFPIHFDTLINSNYFRRIDNLILAVHYYTSSLDHVPDILKVHKKRINTKRIKKRIQRGRRTYHFQRHPTEIIPWLLCGVVKMCRPRAGCPPAILYSAYSSLIKSEYPNGYLLIAFDTKTIADDYRRAG